MKSISSLIVSLLALQMVPSGEAWFYPTSGERSEPDLTGASHIVKHQFLLPPYPTYQHQLLHQQPSSSHLSLNDNRYYGAPGEFAEPTSYNELSFEGPYEVTAPRVPGLYFRLSSGVFVPVKAVYSFPPFLERIVQRIQGYYSVYNPPDTLGLHVPSPDNPTPLPPSGVPISPVGAPLPPSGPSLPPSGAPLPPSGSPEFPVLPPQLPPGEPKPDGSFPPLPPTGTHPGPLPGILPDEFPSTPKPDTEETPSTTTESTKEETTPPGQADETASATESIESNTDSAPEETTTDS